MALPEADRTIFMTRVGTLFGKTCARLLIESLRTFGGEMRHCPFWIYEPHPDITSCRDLEPLGVQVIPLHAPESLQNYFMGEKVFACAQAERQAPSTVHSMVWIDPNCLIVQPPLLFDLGIEFDVAFRPVHVRNVGILAGQPLDAYWQRIYEAVGVETLPLTVESFVDEQRLRAYFNSHAFAFNPAKGLMHEWLEKFETLVCDQAFQTGACQDDAHQVFLFQVLLSVIVAAQVESPRMRLLPPTYNYPYNLQGSVPPARRAKTLNNLVTFPYEDRSIDPNQIQDIGIDEPLRGWLLEREARSPGSA